MRIINTIAVTVLLASGCGHDTARTSRINNPIMARPLQQTRSAKPHGESGLKVAQSGTEKNEPAENKLQTLPRIDMHSVKSGQKFIINKPGQTFPDGTSVIEHVFTGLDNEKTEPTDTSQPDKKSSSQEPAEAGKPSPPAPLPPTRQPDRNNCLYLIEKGSPREKFDAIVFATEEKYAAAVSVLGGVLRKETRYSGAAAQALAAIGGSRAARELYSEVEKGEVPEFRLAAFSALLSMGDESPDRYLVNCLSHKDATIRFWAVQASAVRSLPAAQPQIRAILGDTNQPSDIRVWAAAGVERLSPGDSQARSILLSALHGRSREISATAMDALASIGSAWSVGEIAGLLYSDDLHVAENILMVLLQMKPDAALAALDGASGGYQHTLRYKTAYMAISETPDHAAIATAIASQDALARSLAIDEAAHFKSGTSVPALAMLARSTSSSGERDHAVGALKAIGNAEAKDALIALGETASGGVVSAQFAVTKVFNDSQGALKGVMISDGKQEFMCTPGQESSYGWTLKSIEQNQALLENKDGRKLSLPVPIQPR